MSSPEQAFDQLAEAITTFADTRAGLPLNRLLRETALNILILSRIASNRVENHSDRERIDKACDQLVTELRRTSWKLPDPPDSARGTTDQS